jgi:hypothetical protein
LDWAAGHRFGSSPASEVLSFNQLRAFDLPETRLAQSYHGCVAASLVECRQFETVTQGKICEVMIRY